jgi:hypothetical protein
MIENITIEQLRQDDTARMLLRILDRAYAEGGNDAVIAQLEVWGLSSTEYEARESAQVLARLWTERE